MTRALSLALALVAAPALAKPPRLTLFIAVDALGTDLLLRSRPQLKAGLANLVDRGEVVGAVVRTKTNVRPVFVSVGHRIDLESAVRTILAALSADSTSDLHRHLPMAA